MLVGKGQALKIALPIMCMLVDPRDASYSYSTHIDDSTESKEEDVVTQPPTEIIFPQKIRRLMISSDEDCGDGCQLLSTVVVCKVADFLEFCRTHHVIKI